MPGRLDNRPLLGTIDRDLFVAPPIFVALTAAWDRRLNVLILGAPGSGKTTLLRAAQARGNDSSLPSVYIDLHLASDVEQAITLITEAVGERWPEFGDSLVRERTLTARLRQTYDSVTMPMNELAWKLAPEETSTGHLLRLIRRLGQAPATRLLIDSPPGNGSAFTLFGRLRDELWQQEHQWIVAADDALRSELSRPPANAFFDALLDLAPLSEPEQRRLLTARLGSEPNLDVDVDALVGQTDGLPRSLVSLAREVVLNDTPVQDVVARRSDVRARLAKLPPAAARVIAYLTEHGATSGSDGQLLASLGISGQRARQILRELETDGLVRSFLEHAERQGRPRKLYELTEVAR